MFKDLSLSIRAKQSFKTSEQKNYSYWCNRIDNAPSQITMLRVMRMKAMMEYPSKEKYAKLEQDITLILKLVPLARDSDEALYAQLLKAVESGGQISIRRPLPISPGYLAINVCLSFAKLDC